MFKSIFKTGIRAVYNVLENPSFVSEPWYIYPAKHKTSGQTASVFIFDKSKFEAQVHRICASGSNTKNPKVIISECYEILKYEVSQLAKLKHPQILTIFEVLEETKLKFLFVSEQVTDNLLTVNVTKDLDELSIQKGLLQVTKGLQFLHNYCQIVHLNLQPSSIYINSQGDWKLGGFRFLQNMNEISPLERDNFYIMNNSSVVPFANLNLNFTAPELIIDSQLKLDVANDMWSLGCIIFYVYNNAESLLNCFDANSISDYKTEFRKFENKFYNHRPNELKYLLKNVPDKLYNVFGQILARHPHDRMSIDQFINLDFFNGSMIKAMWFVDEFSTKSVGEKLVFMRGLLETDVNTNKTLLEQFPPSFKNLKLLPLMIELIISELNVLNSKQIDSDIDEAISHALTITLLVGSKLSSLTFQDRIYEYLLKDESKVKKSNQKDTFNKLIGASVKIRLTLVENMSILVAKLNEKQLSALIKQSLTLFLTSAPTEATQQQEQIKLQESFLHQMQLFIDKLDFPYIKNTLIPMICQVFKTTTILSTKLTTVETFGMLVDRKIIDKMIVCDQLLPILQNLKSRNKKIIDAVLNFFVKLCDSEHISLELDSIVESVLPQCFKLAFGCNECSKAEFKTYMKMVNKIQTTITESKINSLPAQVRDETSTSLASNFESLINTQRINEGNKDNITKAPQSKNIMQPTKRPEVKPSASSTPASRSTTATPLVLKPKQKPAPKKPLSFGAVNSNTNTNNTALLNTLQGTYNKSPEGKEPEDDEFDEFQNAEVIQTTSLNWNIESEKSRISSSQQNSPLQLPPTNYPPGFNSSMVLTPTTNGRNNTITNKKSSNHNNGDILDLL